MSKTPDYIVIGSGSAGSVLASRLSETASVVVVEAGPHDHAWDYRVHMPAALSHVLSNDTYNWYYHSEPEPELNNRRMYCPRGRVLGGSSSINGMIYVRGNRGDFDRWAKDPALADWRYDRCLSYFIKSETRLHGDPQYRGDSGPMEIARGAARGPLHEAWLAAGEQAGYRRSSDFNGADQEGVGIFDGTIRSGRRLSSARAYLHPAVARGNVEIIKRALVTRILIEGSRAVGVEYLRRGRREVVRANAEVIVAAGAINSPQLLMLSGIGDPDHLKANNLPVVQALPGVGNNLQDHLEIYVQYSCRQPVSIYPSLKWYRQPFVGLQWYLTQRGPGATNHFETGAFLKSDPAIDYPDLQFHFLPVAMNYDGTARHEGHGFQVHVGPMKPTSRGSVALRDANPASPPVIRFNYHSTQEDRDVMQRGIAVAREIVAQPAFDGLRDRELRPGSDDASLIDAFVRAQAESAYHPAGTCRMGSGDTAVVDGAGRVYGIDSLRVCDASIMPEITNGNLNAPVIMMAEKIADAIV